MIRRLYDKLIRPIVTAHDSPEAIAGGVALGLGIALTPTLGVQMPIALFVATMCRCNRVVAVGMVWISNPITALPLYYGEYLLGARMLGRPGLSFQDFSDRWESMSQLGYLERFQVLFNVLTDIAVPLLVGSGVCAAAATVLSYPMMLVALKRRRARAMPSLARPVGRDGPDGVQQRDATQEPGDEGDQVQIVPQPGSPEQSVDPVDPADRKGKSASARAMTFLALGLGLSSLCACAETSIPGEIQGVVDEVKVGETHPIWYAELEGGLLATLRPFHLAPGRQAYTAERLDGMLGRDGLTYLSLELYSTDPGASDRPLGRDGIRVVARGSAGRIESLRPSDLLGPELEPAHRVVLAPLLGPGALPNLSAGKVVRLLVAMPSGVPMNEGTRWQVELPEGEQALAEVEVEAAAYQKFLSGPSLDAFRDAWRGES